jgi:N-glycosylase/DNA lyase
MSLLKEVRKLQRTDVGRTVDERLTGFRQLNKSGSDEWFSELCFCILAANSKGAVAYEIQKELGASKLCTICVEDVTACIQRHRHRFHNTKARFIVEARAHGDIKAQVESLIRQGGAAAAREWLVRSIKGIGYKEASHFLRNVGYFDLAILDRHVLNLMHDDGMIVRPKTLDRKSYLEIEKRFIALAKKMKMRPGELDLYFWSLKTGYVMK